VRLVGLTVTPVPVPDSDTVCGLPGALSVTETAALLDPVADGRNVTLIVQLAPAAKLDPHVVVREKSPALVPVTVMLLIVMLEFPVFVRVVLRAVLVMFTAWTPNAREAGDRLAVGLVPVPLNETVCGLPLALSATESLAVRDEPTVGVNVTLIEQFVPGAKLEPQLFVAAKSAGLVPEMVMLLIARAAAPLFERVTFCAALVVLIG